MDRWVLMRPLDHALQSLLMDLWDRMHPWDPMRLSDPMHLWDPMRLSLRMHLWDLVDLTDL